MRHIHISTNESSGLTGSSVPDPQATKVGVIFRVELYIPIAVWGLKQFFFNFILFESARNVVDEVDFRMDGSNGSNQVHRLLIILHLMKIIDVQFDMLL